jgi:phage terminase large subunit-like protein
VRDPICVVTRGSSYENRGNLAPAFFDQIIRKYEGTRLGRQELEAETDSSALDAFAPG